MPGWNLEMRQSVAFEFKIDLTAFRDPERILQRTRNITEEGLHLLRGAHVVGWVGHAHPVRVRI